MCQSGFLPSGTSRQCSACTGGQAAGVCATYSSTGTSCACTTCANRYRLDKGSCTECTNNPNCETFRPNSCDCATCKANSTGPSCVAVSAPLSWNSSRLVI